MSEPKEFGETRMFSPDSIHRLHKAVHDGATPPVVRPVNRLSKRRLAIWLVLLAIATAGLVWTYRAPLRGYAGRLLHR